MTSDKGAPADRWEERLAAERDSVLQDGENLVAFEIGDQGQAIALTDARVIVIKIGLTATGTLDGRVVTSFAFDDISSLNIRRGPKGAVLQILSAAEKPAVHGGPPPNIVVFSGEELAQRCETIGKRISEALGKPIGVIQPTAQQLAGIEYEHEKTTPQQEQKRDEQTDQATIADAGVADSLDISSTPVVGSEDRAESHAELQSPVQSDVKVKPGRSLADEIYAEIVGSSGPTHEVASPSEPQSVSQTQAPEQHAVQVEPEPEPVATHTTLNDEAIEDSGDHADAYADDGEEDLDDIEFGPNPNLPKPVKKKKAGPSTVLVLLGVSAVLLIAGLAILAPLRNAQEPPATIDIAVVSRSPAALRSALVSVKEYRAKTDAIIAQNNSAAAALESALRAKNANAIAAAASAKGFETTWQSLIELPAPAGLAGSKQSLLGALAARKAAAAHAGSAPERALQNLAEARELIKQGIATMQAMQTDLQKQIADLESALRQKNPTVGSKSR